MGKTVTNRCLGVGHFRQMVQNCLVLAIRVARVSGWIDSRALRATLARDGGVRRRKIDASGCTRRRGG